MAKKDFYGLDLPENKEEEIKPEIKFEKKPIKQEVAKQKFTIRTIGKTFVTLSYMEGNSLLGCRVKYSDIFKNKKVGDEILL